MEDNDNHRYLVVYESPSKFKLFRNLFNEIGLDCKFAYTQGRVFDLPSDEYGIDSSNNMTFVPVDEYRLKHLRNAIENADTVFCLTDMDDEGEWIADSVKRLCYEHGECDFLRLRLNSYSIEDLIEAIKTADETLDNDAIAKAHSRRYIDRYLGYSDNDDRRLQRGRVLTPVLFNIYEDPIHLNREACVISGEYVFKTRTMLPDKVLSEVVKTLSSSLSNEELLPVNIRDSLPTTEECLMYEMSRVPDKSATDAFGELQSLYENGEISYPRTENSKYYVMEGKHSGIKALEYDDNSDDDDSLFSLIKKRTVLAQSEHKISTINVSGKLEEKLNENGLFYTKIFKLENQEYNSHALSLIAPLSLLNRLGDGNGYNDGVVFSIKLSSEQRVLSRLTKTNLAQPSTLHIHTDKISSLVQEEEGVLRLNSRGLKIAVQGDQLSVTMRNMENAHEINNILNKKGLKVEDKIAKCLNVLNHGVSSHDENEFTL